MEKPESKLLIDQILNTIEKLNKKHEEQNSMEGLRQMVWERLPFLKSNAGTMTNELIYLYKTYKKKLEVSKDDNNVYTYDLQIRINVIQKMIEDGYKETKLQLIRAKYNLETINHIFIMLNFMINDKDEYRRKASETLYNPSINKNINMFKLNMSFLIINLIFENIRDKIDEILSQPKENTEILTGQLLKEYNGDAQTLGEVLASRWKDVNGKPEHQQYRIMREKLIEEGFDTNKTPIFKIARNSSSHGEFYPIIRTSNDIDIKIDNEGEEKKIISLQTLLTFVDSKISILSSIDEYSIFIDFYKSTDLIATMEQYKKQGKADEVIKLLAVLSMYNIVQYNTEQLFESLNSSKISPIRKVDSLDIKKYFTTSYNSETRDNYEILKTIKHAIGHMNVEYENGNITFDNKKENESCTTSIYDLFAFSLKSGIYNVAIATAFYQHYIEEVKMKTMYINNIKIYNEKNNNYYKIESNKQDIYNNINKKYY